MTTCPRSRSHKLRCSATPLAHDYRQQRARFEADGSYLPEPLPVRVYEVRGGRQRRTRLYGPGYQPCQGERGEASSKPCLWPAPFHRDGYLAPATGCPKQGDYQCQPFPWPSEHAGRVMVRCSEGLPTYPYTTCCP